MIKSINKTYRHEYPHGILAYRRMTYETETYDNGQVITRTIDGYNPYGKLYYKTGIPQLIESFRLIVLKGLIKLNFIERKIDWSTVEIDTNTPRHRYDPDYWCDYYYASASWNDGTPLSDTELDEMNEQYQDELQSLIESSLY